MQDDVDAAAQMIEDLLQPQDETRNEHKRLQLRELAQLNGTLKDEEARLPLSKLNSLWPPVDSLHSIVRLLTSCASLLDRFTMVELVFALVKWDVPFWFRLPNAATIIFRLGNSELHTVECHAYTIH